MARTFRSKAARVRAPFVITASLALLAPACGGSANGGEGGAGGSGASGGAGGSGGSGGASQGCPTSAPDDGTSCAASPGANCRYDRCGAEGLPDLIATCSDGQWDVRDEATCNPPPPAECPTSEPTSGTYCEVAADQYCSYPTSECCPDVEARCLDNEWEVAISSCNPPPPPPCPEEMPEDGSSCAPEDVCGYSVQTCSYGVCDEGGTDAFTAFCDGSTWSVRVCHGV